MATTLTATSRERLLHREHFRRCTHVFTLLKHLAGGADTHSELSEADLHERMLAAADGYGPVEWAGLGANQDTATAVLTALRVLVASDSPIPRAVVAYFGSDVIPVVHATCNGARWITAAGSEPVTVAFARSMRRYGVERVAVRVGNRTADFAVEELDR